jgi:hypothetical protein
LNVVVDDDDSVDIRTICTGEKKINKKGGAGITKRHQRDRGEIVGAIFKIGIKNNK